MLTHARSTILLGAYFPKISNLTTFEQDLRPGDAWSYVKSISYFCFKNFETYLLDHFNQINNTHILPAARQSPVAQKRRGLQSDPVTKVFTAL